MANIAVGLVVVVVSAAFGARIWVGTLANALLVGTFIDLLLEVGAVTELSESPLGVRVGLLFGGICVIGGGSGFYIGAALGAGPRDSLMLALSQRSGMRIGVVRAAIELTALGAGWVLGGTVGIGTVAIALLVGPSVELAFFILERSPLAAPAVPRAAASMEP